MGKDSSSKGFNRLLILEAKISKKTIVRDSSQIHKERGQLKRPAVPTLFKLKGYNQE